MKKLVWLGTSKKRMTSFPESTKEHAGKELYRIQAGELPTNWRSMPNIGTGVIEIRIHRPNEYRIFYVANYPEAIYVLHAFQKKSRNTSELDKQLGKKRYADLQRLR